MMGYVPGQMRAIPGRPTPPKPERVWQHDDTLTSLCAAPGWAMAWVLSLGRYGKPLWRDTRTPEEKARAQMVANWKAGRGNLTSEPGPPVPPTGYTPTHGGDDSHPPQGGSGGSGGYMCGLTAAEAAKGLAALAEVLGPLKLEKAVEVERDRIAAVLCAELDEM